jgi:hypothetical protein
MLRGSLGALVSKSFKDLDVEFDSCSSMSPLHSKEDTEWSINRFTDVIVYEVINQGKVDATVLWDLGFSQLWVWKLLSSEMWRHVVL